MIDLSSALGPDTFEALMRGVARGKYQVLLGAGASVTSGDRHGNTLPGGNKLRDEIVSDFEMPNDETPSLKRAYQFAKTRITADGETRSDYFIRRFTQTKPAAWYESLLMLPWAGLWTLNIDDCVERTNTHLAGRSRQQLKSISWTDKHSVSNAIRDELLLVHLHGKASRATKEDELVFDIASYVNAATNSHRWHKVFGDEFPVAPFLVIGASLDEEFDLQNVFDEGRAASATIHPSIVILRSISEFSREEYEGYGLIPLACTAEDFFSAVQEALPPFLKELAPHEAFQSTGTPPETFRFLKQWKLLESGATNHTDIRHDIFSGHEPRWSDATQGLISSRAVIQKIKKLVTADLAPGKHAVEVVTGEAFSGKTAILMKACSEIEAQGFTPYQFDKESAIDIDAVIYWMRHVPRTVLIIDDAADFARDLANLISDPRTRDLSIRIILTDRVSRRAHIRDAFLLLENDRISVDPSLNNAEVSSLVDLLSSHNRLGELTQKRPGERKLYFNQHRNRLFSAMAELENGRGFKNRVVEEFDRIKSNDSRRLLAVTGLAARLGYSMPLEVVKLAAGVSAREADILVNSSLSDLLTLENGRIRPRHRVFGELLIEYLSLEEKIEAVVNLALAVAPHVSHAAITSSTIFYRISRSLLANDMLFKLLDSNYGATSDVYERIQTAYEWNARFWDQRALLASNNNRFEKAFSWAQQALLKRKDSYSLNTIGTVLMRRAVHEASEGQWPTETFENAHSYLLDARTLEKETAEYPIDTFFYYTTRLLELVKNRDSGLNLQISILWNNWYSSMLLVNESTKIRLAKTQKDALLNWKRFSLDSQNSFK